MLLLGIDLGTSSVKVSVVDAQTRQVVASASYPDEENPILTPQPGFAEQQPERWWACLEAALGRAHATGRYDPQAIGAVGIAYQMHGLVVLDAAGRVLRPAIIWCDSRAIPYGEAAFGQIGPERALAHLLNSPGNFTAAKLAWVKDNEPDIFEKIDKIMLPGDYFAYRLTGQLTTSASALSEGIFWDFKQNKVSGDVLQAFGFSPGLLPTVQPLFSIHGTLSEAVARQLGLRAGIPVSYKAGDQPNNALSLNVFEPGEVAATAGTSGVIYAVTDQIAYDPQSRVNTFVHVNHATDAARLGILLCINGTGSLYRWMRQQLGGGLSYAAMNTAAASAPVGSGGVVALPFGNGAERVLNNRDIGAVWQGIDFNSHTLGHLLRAGLEGVACSLRYGLEIMTGIGTPASVIRAGHANLFLSEVFCEAFVNLTGTPLERYDTDGAKGAALGAGIGAGVFATPKEAFGGLKRLDVREPDPARQAAYEQVYERWRHALFRVL